MGSIPVHDPGGIVVIRVGQNPRCPLPGCQYIYFPVSCIQVHAPIRPVQNQLVLAVIIQVDPFSHRIAFPVFLVNGQLVKTEGLFPAIVIKCRDFTGQERIQQFLRFPAVPSASCCQKQYSGQQYRCKTFFFHFLHLMHHHAEPALPF